jgi:hypothetical protein
MDDGAGQAYRARLGAPMSRRAAALALMSLSACKTDAPAKAPAADAPIAFCEGQTEALYDLLDPDELLAFPDDAWTVADASSPTGRRVAINAETAPWTAELAVPLQPIVAELSERSGFARLGGVVMRFSAPVGAGPADPATSQADPGLQWWDLSVDPPERVPFSVRVGEAGDQIVLEPLVTLRGGAEHAVVLTSSFTDAGGGCIRPADGIRARLSGESGDAELDARVAEAVAAAGVAPGDVGHVLVYTTHDDLLPMVEAAAHARASAPGWADGPYCRGEDPVVCEGAFVANDYRTEGGVEGPEPQDTWLLQPVIWLPADAEGPVPVAVFGHGLNSRSGGGAWLASLLADLGVAVVALDALHHGVHPTADPDDDLPAMAFLGLDLANLRLDARGLRGSFDQSTLDRLQLLSLLRAHPDLDGDGQDDLDMGQLLYFGVSLGGLMGPPLMALEPDIGAGVFAVGGGKLSAFATDTEVVASLAPVIEALVGPPDEFARLLPVLQAAVDPSDPAVWGAHVLEDRFDDAPAPDLLFPVAQFDETVPPSSAKALARGLRIPHLSPVPDPVPTLTVVDGPLAGNGPGGATVAYFQLDRVTEGGVVEAANHDNVPGSDEVRWMTLGLFDGHLSGSAVLADPYAELGTPALD